MPDDERRDEDAPDHDEEPRAEEPGTEEPGSAAGEHRILEDPDPDPDSPPPPATYAGRQARAEGPAEDALAAEDTPLPADEPISGAAAEEPASGEAPAEAPGAAGHELEGGTGADAGPDTSEFLLEGEITEDEVAAEIDRGEEPDPEAPAGGEEGEAEAGGEQEEARRPEPGATVEADTVGLADREAAKEAALAGLRNRTAEQAARRQRSTGKVPAATAAGAKAAASQAAASEASSPPAQAPPAGKEPPHPQAPPQPAPAPVALAEEAEKRRGLWPRFVAASLVVVISMATATAVSLLVYLTDIAKGLGGLEGLQGQLDDIEGGKPQNFLILGSDVRPTDTDRGRSDTTILLRIDPNQDQISMLSLPRDLKVNIPNHGVDRLNAAYTYGGPELTLKTVKALTGINVNHIVNVDFLGFADAVNAIDCVYIDVDRHYFHSNVGLAAEEQYAEIDIEAGYQRLCGYKALQYVRYRHDDNDLVRSARQQGFLREARQGVPPGKLLADRNELIDIFKKYTTSDINDIATLIDLFKLMFAARGAPVNQIQFRGDIGGPESSYVTASSEQIRNAVEEFMGEDQDEPTPPPGEERKPGGGGGDGDKPGGDGGDQSQPPPLVDSTAVGQQYADSVNSREFDESIYYPTKLNPGGQIADDSRAIKIDGPGQDVYYGYKLVVAFQALGYTAYYGFSGTDWKDPPILAKPTATREIDGEEYLLFYDRDRLRLVGWKEGKASYWVTNTLGQLLSEEQMLGIATSAAKVEG